MYVYPADIYLLKFSNVNTRRMREICSKLTKRTPERQSSGVPISDFEQVNADHCNRRTKTNTSQGTFSV